MMNFYIKSAPLLLLVYSTLLTATTVTSSFQLQAQISNGCIMGSSSSDTTNFGNLNFGTITTLDNNVTTSSTSGSGSVVIQCTPGLPVTIALNAGLNAGGNVTSGRFMLISAGSATLRYQLFQDSARSIVWGNGSNGGSSMSISASGAIEEHKIYGLLYAATTAPPAGSYSDTVTVTVTY